MTKSEWQEFEFVEHQLGVIDTKANNVLLVDAVLIVISTLSSLFEGAAGPFAPSLATAATLCVLISVGLCVKTIWTKWATDIGNKKELIKFRGEKTTYLHWSLRVLVVALGLYSVVLLIRFI